MHGKPGGTIQSGFLAGGEMGALMRAHDWSITPLGPPESWPVELRTLVGVMLGSRQPMFITWGPARTLLYNDGYVGIIGRKHPAALAQPFLDVWSEIRGDLGPLLAQVDSGESVHMDHITLLMERHGYREETHFAFSYSPVRDEAGRVAGMFCPCQETTGQVLAARRNVAERERLEQLFEQAPGFMAILRGPEHVFELVNRAYLQLIGHRDVIGKPVRQALPEVEGQGYFELLDQVYRDAKAFEGNALKVELQRHAGGEVEERFIDLVYQPITDADGRVTGIFAEGSDVTERVHAEAALRASEERLRLVVEGAKDHAIFTTDPHGAITSWSAGAQAIFGWNAAEAIGQPASIVFTPEDRESGVDLRELAIAAREGCANDERWHLRRDGSRVFMNGSVHALHDAAGGEQGFLKVARDETARRDSEARARELAAQQAATLSQLAEGVIVTDREGRITLVNEAAARIHGVDRLDVAPEDYGETYSLLTEAGRPYRSLDLPLARAVRGDTVIDARWRIRRADGEDVLAVGNARPVRDETGRQIGAVLTLRDDTARVAAEAALRESEAHYRNAAELNPQVAWTAMPDGQLDRVAERWRDWTGTSGLGASWGEGLHSDDLRPMTVAWARSVETGIPYDIEHRVKMLSGQYRWARSRAFPRRDAEGRIVKWYGSTEDIHEQTLAEARLRESEARFRTVAEAMPGFVWTADEEGDLDYTSPSWHAYSGLDPNGSLGEGWASSVHADDQPGALARWSEAVATRTPYDAEFRLRRADGAYRWWLARALPSVEETTGRLRWIGICTELEDIIAARETLARSREDLERRVAERTRERDRAWRNSQDLLVVTEADGTLTAVNDAWTALLGWEARELIGARVVDFTHPEDLEATLIAFAGIIEAPLTRPFEYRLRCKDGAFNWFAWTGAYEDGRIYATGRHVTAEKEQAEALHRAEEQLRQAQKMEAVGQLTGGIAHDFNNLLAGIVGSLDLMQTRMAQGRTDRVERYAKAAMSSAQRAAALTHRLLAFSRRQPLDPRAVNVNQLVTGMEDLLRRSIGPLHGLEIVTAGGLWTTLCDPNQLESAILNLAINARDAMPDGGKLTIETANSHLDEAYVAAQRDVVPGQYIAICITDTGTGMSPDVIARACEPFFTTKPLGQGTGLGLSMVYGFAKQSEGHLKIYSEDGKGTTMRIYLPRYRGEAGEEDPTRAGATDPDQAGTGEIVLVVEDEPVIRDLIVEVLQDLGYRALEAADGPAGLKLLQSPERIDLLVTDVGLPGLNGRQLADLARERRPELKVLFITGYAENAAIANGFLDAGMEMITKPFAIDALAGKIRGMIRSG